MKKTTALILALLMCLPFVACGDGGSASSGEDSVQTENNTPVDTAAATDAETAAAPDISEEESTEEESTEEETTVEETTSEPEPVYEKIEITMDNWQEYFEFRHVEDIKYNAFNEWEDTWIYYYFVTKDGIVPLAGECSVTVEVTHYVSLYDSESFDEETKPVTLSGGSRPFSKSTDVYDLTGTKLDNETEYRRLGAHCMSGIIHENSAQTREDWEVTRIQGTLTVLVSE